MKKLIVLMSIFLIASISEAGLCPKYFTYSATSEVNQDNLNGNIDTILNCMNNSLTNDNADVNAGYRFIEIVDSLPAAGNQGRVVFLTSDNTLYFDDGSQFTKSAVFLGSQSQGDILYHNGTTWVLLSKSTTSSHYLSNQAASNNPQWEKIDLGSGVEIASQAQGDVLYFDGTNWARLAAGTANKFLQTQGGGANPQWGSAGSVYTSSTSISATSTSVTISADKIYEVIITIKGNASSVSDLNLRFNSDTGTNYKWMGRDHDQAGVVANSENASDTWIDLTKNSLGTSSHALIKLTMTNPNTSDDTQWVIVGETMVFADGAGTPLAHSFTYGGTYDGSSAVTSFQIISSATPTGGSIVLREIQQQ